MARKKIALIGAGQIGGTECSHLKKHLFDLALRSSGGLTPQ